MKKMYRFLILFVMSIVFIVSLAWSEWKRIVNLDQTAVEWDLITPEWVNAVNSKMKEIWF